MKLRIGIVGATGIVGSELITLIAERGTPVGTLRLFASEKSGGKKVPFGEDLVIVEKLESRKLTNFDYLFFCSNEGVSREFLPTAAANGICCIDNSAAFRERGDVPLVVPEINSHALAEHKNVIANPNCSTIITLMAIFPLHVAFGLKKFCATTYQAVSGVGCSGIEALNRAIDGNHAMSEEIFGEQILFNAVPKVGKFFANGYTSEEMKMLNESRRILGFPDLRVSSTCVRIPAMRAHSISVIAEFERSFDLCVAQRILRENEHVDYFPGTSFPSAIERTKKDRVGVGRLRVDTFFDNGATMWVVGDQIRKGAALNALQIMELLEFQKCKSTPIPLVVQDVRAKTMPSSG
ncbi:MAG: aspartate-semialdehyde dehydrogenase [Puniceicoccales bacterium]|jgi:aspartate-semialdehyde dehydrogenase|nr:aspartate-semialdehyde dehydrogenase [Puniceicoccales bacterium]